MWGGGNVGNKKGGVWGRLLTHKKISYKAESCLERSWVQLVVRKFKPPPPSITILHNLSPYCRICFKLGFLFIRLLSISCYQRIRYRYIPTYVLSIACYHLEFRFFPKISPTLDFWSSSGFWNFFPTYRL